MSYTRHISGQGFLINSLITFNYDREQGVCAGATLTVLESYLVDDLDSIKVQLWKIYLINKKLQEESIDQDSIKQLRQILDTEANRDFFYRLSIYQIPKQLSKSRGIYLSQHKIEELSTLVAAPKIMAHGGLRQIFVLLNFFDRFKIANFLTLIEHYATHFKLGFSISCNGHRIGLGYNPITKEWAFIEPELFPVLKTVYRRISRRNFSQF